MIPPGVASTGSSAAVVVCVVLLLVILAQKELFRTYTRNRATARYVHAAGVPLAAVAMAAFLVRVASYLR